MELSCEECGSAFHVDEMPNRGAVCFKCHIGGLTFRFIGGGGYGKRAFHDNTIGEVQREIVESAKAEGITARPVGARWV